MIGPRRERGQWRCAICVWSGLALWLGCALALGARELAPPRPELLLLPLPEIGGVEEEVRRHLEATVVGLEAAIQSAKTDEALAVAYGTAARVFHAYSFYGAAVAGYENARRLQPTAFPWTYLLGYAFQSEGRSEEAEEALVAALDLAPDDVPARVRLGYILLESGRFSEAKALLDGALGDDPDNALALHGLAQVAAEEGDDVRAVELLEAAIAADPSGKEFHAPLAQAYRRLGDLESARRHAALYAPSPPRVRDPLALEVQRIARGAQLPLIRGTKLFREGKLEAAAAAFEEALSRDPESVEALVNLGTARAGLGDVEAAKASLARAVELDPASGTANFNLGVLLVREERWEAAIERLQEAAAAGEDDFDLWSSLALALRNDRRFSAAAAAYERLAVLEESPEWSYLGRSYILADQGRFEESLHVLEDGHRELPAAGRLAHALARILASAPDLELRDGARAAELALRVVQAQPTIAHATTLALALGELGRCAEAAGWQRQVLDAAGATAAAERSRMSAALELYSAGPPCRPPGTRSATTPTVPLRGIEKAAGPEPGV